MGRRGHPIGEIGGDCVKVMKKTLGEILAMGVALLAVSVCLVALLWHNADKPERAAASEGERLNAVTASAPAQGRVAPDFQLYDYQGRLHKLSDYRGKPVVLNFWASWCGPCRMEMPAFAQASNAYKGKIQFLGVNLTVRDPIDSSKELIKTAHVQYPNLQDKSGKVAGAYKIQGIPTTYLLDKEGRIVQMVIGHLTKRQLDELLPKLLQK